MNDTQEAVITITVMFSIIAGIVGLAILVGAQKCEAQWAHSGLRSDYGPIQGCLVQLPDGRWLPASAVRDVEIRK